MDDRRFDTLTRVFATRRATLAGVAALLGLGVAGVDARNRKHGSRKNGTSKNGNKKNGNKKNGNKKNGNRKNGNRKETCKPKCSVCQNCVKGKCEPKQNGVACGAGSACCGGGCCQGCCDGTTCRVGTAAGACGAGGTACAICAQGQDCASGTCTCGGASCTGCCDGTTCRPGDTVANCGVNGGVCDQCSGTGVTCGGGGPGVCGCNPQSDAATCAGKCGTAVPNNCGTPVDCTALCAGCCDGGICRSGNTFQMCGANGALCGSCSGCQSCSGGTCVAGCGPCATCNGATCDQHADGTACGTNGGCDDGRCFRKFDFCDTTGGCSRQFAVAQGGAGLNLCRAAGAGFGANCDSTAECPDGSFCAVIGSPICTQGCPA